MHIAPRATPASLDRLYATDVEGGAVVTVRMEIAGQFGDDYLTFMASRANWLSLCGWVRPTGPGAAELVASGPEALVGALEMACILGPIGALIARVDCAPSDEVVPAGFAIRR